MTKGTKESLTKVAYRGLLVSTALTAALSATAVIAQDMGGSLIISARPDMPPASASSGPIIADRPSEAPDGGMIISIAPSITPAPTTPTISSNRPTAAPPPAPVQIISNVPTAPSTPPPVLVVAPKPGDMPVSGGGGNPGQGGGGGDEPDPDRPTDIPTGPILPTFDGIGLSALAPPENVTVTQAVEITAGPVGDQQFVQATGQTLFGAVQDPSAFDMVEVEIQPSGRTTMVDVSPMTGQFATRVFEEDFGNDGSATVNLTAMNSNNSEVEPASISYTLQQAMPEDGFVQALSRITYGATPQLYSRVRSIGFAAYVEEQLNPDTMVNDSFFDSLNLDDLINRGDRNVGNVLNDLIEHSIAHAAYSERQLQEIMGEFWSNHFHATDKGASMQLQAVDDREFFRQNAFGNFADMLKYSARSPLMSRYLDNTDNRAGRINENYGREILELHTVGVDGGYDDDDVIAVSRIFTGWTYDWVNDQEPARSNEPRRYVFEFRSDRHDTGDKEVDFLGLTITGREGPQGIEEGDELIDALTADPRTQNFVCRKIVQLLVSDTPPQGFVDSCVAAWAASGGNTEAMLRAILLDPAYINSPELQRTKAKTPYEMTASFVRAFDFLPPESREANFFRDLREATTNAGFNPPRFPAPTGLPEVGAAWLNTNALIEQYKELTSLADDADDFGSDIQALLLNAGLETAEEAAAYMLAVATADRYREEEYNAVVRELKGSDGFFEPATEDETRALRRAIAIITSSPSFHLQ